MHVSLDGTAPDTAEGIERTYEEVTGHEPHRRQHTEGRRLPDAGRVGAPVQLLDGLAERPDNWRLGGKPAQEAFSQVAAAICEHEPLTMVVSGSST